jgi:hypothetical protein
MLGRGRARLHLLLSVLLLPASTGVLACASAPKAPLFTVDQAELKRAVVARLSADDQVTADAIVVDVKGNTVRLTGTVPDEAQRTRAGSVALGTRGVRAVVNRLDVAEPTSVVAEGTRD